MDLFYRKYGEGHPFVILHGLYGSSDNWVSIANAFSNMFEIYLPDQRNHGKSEQHPEHNYDLMCTDLYNFYQKHNIEKAILLGHSMGGKTAMLFAQKYPELISRLIIADIAPKSYIEIAQKADRSLNHYKILESLLEINLNNFKSRPEIESELKQKIGNEKIAMFLMKNLHRNKDNSFSWIINIKALYNNMEKILDNSLNHNLAPVTGFPVLFMRGAKSDYISDSDIPEIKRIFPYSDIVSVPEASHWLHADNPEQFIKLVRKFILG